MPWYHAVAERDHEIQNPTSPEKIRLLGERLRLGPETEVLDVASGKCGPAVILAGEFGCRIPAIERAPEFLASARERVAAAGLGDRIEIHEQDAAEADLGHDRYDVAMCLGASFVWGSLEGTLAALTPTAHDRGAVVVGEPYWRRWQRSRRSRDPQDPRAGAERLPQLVTRPLRLGDLRRAEALGRSQQRGLRQQGPERRRLERMASRPAGLDLELGEDRLGLGRAALGGPLSPQPRIELVEAVVGVEDPPDDELRRHRPVPVVLLQAEGDVVVSDPAVAVELPAHAERNRAAGDALPADAKAEVLPLADGRRLHDLAGGRQEGHVRVAETERRQASQLLTELERQLRPARQDGVDHRRRGEILRREGVRERLDPLREDRQARGRAMAAEALEVASARSQRAVEVERRDRPPRALPQPLRAGDQDDRTVIALDETGGDDPDHALVPVLTPEDIGAAPLLRLRPLVDLRDRGAKDAFLHGLAVAIQLLELVGEPPGLVAVAGEQQLEGGSGMAEPAGCVDARREPEPDGARVHGGRIDSRETHQRLKPRLAGPRESPQARNRERPVLADERDDVRDRRERDQIQVAAERRGIGPEKRLAELEDDAGSAQLRERIVGRPRRHDRAIRQLPGRPVVVGDDDLEPTPARLRDLGDRSDPAVDGQHQPAALVGEPFERRARDPVPLVETARQVPFDVGAELPQDEHCQHRRADPVGVVVAVDANAPPLHDRRADPLHRGGHVPEQEWVVQRLLAGEEGFRLLGVAVAAPDENARGDLADAELLGEGARLPVRARTDRPGALVHCASTLRRGSDGTVPFRWFTRVS